MAKVQTSNEFIICPHCGAQYLPGEIYTWGSFLGRPTSVLRDALGKILYYEFDEDKEPDLEEHYICDHCDQAFNIEATVQYKSKPEAEELDFKKEYVSLLD